MPDMAGFFLGEVDGGERGGENREEVRDTKSEERRRVKSERWGSLNTLFSCLPHQGAFLRWQTESERKKKKNFSITT